MMPFLQGPGSLASCATIRQGRRFRKNAEILLKLAAAPRGRSYLIFMNHEGGASDYSCSKLGLHNILHNLIGARGTSEFLDNKTSVACTSDRRTGFNKPQQVNRAL